jgi:hypothetical protein
MIDFDKLLTYNPEVTHAFHGKIMECDMREASLQIAEVFHYLPQNVIDELKLLPKKDRVVRVGNIQKQDPSFSDKYYTKLKEVRKHFIEVNNITDDEIISIHSDALFINTRRKLKMVVDGIEFKAKHQWTSYIRYENIEMFYNDDDESITYKGIRENVLDKHTIGMCRHILKVFKMIENNDDRIYHYLSEYQTQYLKGELPENCYLPFTKINGKYFNDNLKLLAYLAQIAMKEC